MAEVAKFGGTSMAQVDTVAWISAELDPVVMVVSAPGKDINSEGLHWSPELGTKKMTDMLLDNEVEQAEARAIEIAGRAGLNDSAIVDLIESMHDWLDIHKESEAGRAATGERFSAELIAQLTGRILLEPRELISINRNKTPDVNVSVNNLRNVIDPTQRYVLAGYYGYDNESINRVQVLGRGSSDTTGVLVAAALELPYANFTDVNGFYTTNPSRNPNAQPIANLIYQEARALALGGSGLLHPEVARIMHGRELPTTVRNTFDIGVPGTTISNTVAGERAEIIGVASREVLALDIQKIGMDETAGVMREVYDALAEKNIPYLVTNDGADETTIIFDRGVVKDPDLLTKTAESAIGDATITVNEFGLVVGVFSKQRPYAASVLRAVAAAYEVDPAVIPSSSFSGQSIELFTAPERTKEVEAAVHDLIVTA